MTEQTYLIVTIRKEVLDKEAGKTLYATVKERFKDRPDLDISGHVTNHFSMEE